MSRSGTPDKIKRAGFDNGEYDVLGLQKVLGSVFLRGGDLVHPVGEWSIETPEADKRGKWRGWEEQVGVVSCALRVGVEEAVFVRERETCRWCAGAGGGRGGEEASEG